ncbi:MAG: UDP-3-O-(3-hydroxymyristoyl)glucosamine N-acyltransferase [Myxococcales bacterium]|nr:UDP-3-O-(3-hydroxymyristoyl)glucosamine N-acyltransferase [Myxococcales bacterium]MCB9552849.1 UDP-3-O-(3-hydroxymyristoyl)glucosamine N-acyltransferase [Myxococcales bacterium]
MTPAAPPRGVALTALAAALDARLDGPAAVHADDPAAHPDDRIAADAALAAVRITHVAALADADDTALAAFFERRHRAAAAATRAAAVITTAALAPALPPDCARLVCADPRAAWHRAIRQLHPRPTLAPPPVGVDPRAAIDPAAAIDPTAAIGPFAVVGPRATINAGAVVAAHAIVAADAVIGEGATLAPRATVLDGCVIEADAWIGPGATIGSIGFGLDAHGRLPHPGRARVGRGATIGAGSCVDRATVGWTTIGPGAHLDNLVQIGHNASIGAGAVLCGQVGIAGGARIGAAVVIGGQAGVAGHLEVAPGVRLAAQSGVTRPLTAPGDYSGHPAEPNRARLRRLARQRRAAAPETGEAER